MIFSLVSLSDIRIRDHKQPLEAPAILVLRTAVKQTFQRTSSRSVLEPLWGVPDYPPPDLKEQQTPSTVWYSRYCPANIRKGRQALHHFIISPNENCWIEDPARVPSGGLHKWLNQPSGPERSCTHGAGAKSWSESHVVSALWLIYFTHFDSFDGNKLPFKIIDAFDGSKTEACLQN